MFWGSAPEGGASTHPVGTHFFHRALQHLSHAGRDVATEGGECLANMKLMLEKTTGEKCLDSLPMTKGRDRNNLLKERERGPPAFLAMHVFILSYIHFFPGHSHFFSLVSSTDVSELLSPLGDEHFTLLSAGDQRRPRSFSHSTPCPHLFYGLVYFAQPCTGHLVCWHNEFLWRMAFQNDISVKSAVASRLKIHMGSKFCLPRV